MLVALVFSRDDNRVTHGGMLRQGRFDFAQLDAKPAHLHLVVEAAEKFDASVIAIANQIARAIQPRVSLRKRIADKSFIRQLWAVEIIASEAIAADVKFACHADGNWTHVLVKHVNVSVRDRFPDWH